jgi:hypothetical protein
MASYTIYHPAHKGHNPSPVGINTYFTELLAYELKTVLFDMGHEANITYINLCADNKVLYIPEVDINVSSDGPYIPDSLWFIIVNDETKNFVIVDLQDAPSVTRYLQTLPGYVMSLLGQYSLERYHHENPWLDFTKLLPFVYFPYYPNVVESMIEEIQDIRNSSQLDDRVFFFGNNRDDYLHDGVKIREVISALEYKYPDEVCVGSTEKKLPMQDFFRKAATHTINLGLPGHQWCSREHELWTLGLPVMLYEHTHHLAIDLIPNYHYIAVPVGSRLSIGMASNPMRAADQIIKAHREWIKPSNKWRLNNIAYNGQRRILEQASPKTVIPKLIDLIQLGNW